MYDGVTATKDLTTEVKIEKVRLLAQSVVAVIQLRNVSQKAKSVLTAMTRKLNLSVEIDHSGGLRMSSLSKES